MISHRDPNATATPDSSASDEARYDAQVLRDLPRNFAANLAHGMLGMTGFRLMSAPTFVPAYIYMLSGSKLAVGLALGAQFLGMTLSSIWGATLIEHRNQVMRVVYAVGWLMRLQILGLALSAFVLSGSWALGAACVFLALFGFFGGVQGVTFNVLMSKVIPVTQRGRLTGMRNFLGGLTASGVAYLGGEYLVGSNAFGNGYASTFMLAFILTSIGISALAFVREPKSLTVRASPSRFMQRLADVPGLLRADPHYRRFFFARALAALGTSAVPFYILHAGQFVRLSGATLGYFSLAFLLSQMISNLAWGRIADRHGYRLVFILGVCMWCCATLLLILGGSLPLFLLAFCGLGAGFGGYQVAAQNFVLEFGKAHELPMLIAISDTASHLMMAIGPLVGGIIATQLGYAPIFWMALAFKTLALAMVLRIEEPRHRQRARIRVC
ncbi:MFS transporter [Verminephrobacter eiseniae]|uniref:MFS transporter n=1 Tax=Verminephrobacter eiseniae TaxID=364317 RepID=UPI0022371C85|nr:MFS transporter [Verminephrobacter eiseniae]MCW5232794.1 MFS transporter [Verminephrobacter eiseniae]MCW5295642.1 MFS transporter [Verminephrobacter eiseniae]MCW8184770.1 MFS transporter [Verminephrobacter eiseniae]MCW8221760.1 MFS transporter [Verminephrobacter eiseniae]MCW8232551.1 MFS transporter [Verminephrobacter eiseniae]